MDGLEQLGKRLAELDAIPGVSGDEEQVAAYMQKELRPCVDDFYEDALGNQVFVKRGSNPEQKIMLCAHMDEIGFVVNHIDEKGFVSFLPVGYHDSRMVMNQVLAIHTDQGQILGITGSKPAHLVSEEESKLAIPMEELYLDVGTTNREATLALGVQVGDYITFHRRGQFLNGSTMYTGKSVDNRAGCTVMIEVMKRLAAKSIGPTVYAVASVQEEVGLRGAGTAAYAIQPDVALALDVALSGGTPKMDEKISPIAIGKGPVILFYEWEPSTGAGNNVPKRLTRKLVEAAERYSIPYQRGVGLGGSTDAYTMSISGRGAVTGCVSVPSRYIHSATGMVQLEDIEYTIQLVESFIEGYQK
ncbi:M42 family metallopeptidase [Brevibacillus reuszeri]|uniref:M42 family metallopeptidase n=1 Tax=Brevibacillus reuszeri TaxID=54915 RepID=UPI003D1BCEA9